MVSLLYGSLVHQSRFNLEGLKQECILRMAHCMDTDTVAAVAELAHLHSLSDLWETCIDYASEHQGSVFASRTFASLWEGPSRSVAREFTAQVSSRTMSHMHSLRQQLKEAEVLEGGAAKRQRTNVALALALR